MTTSRPPKRGRKRKNVGGDEAGHHLPEEDDARAVAFQLESLQIPAHIEQPTLLQKMGRRQPKVAQKLQKRDPQPSTVRYSAAVDLRKMLLRLTGASASTSSGFGGKYNIADVECDDERKLVRYHYFIHEGVDVAHVAPIDRSWNEGILSRLPASLRHRASVDTLLEQIREEFFFSVKKSIIDFTIRDDATADEKIRIITFADTSHLKTRNTLFERIKNKIWKNLYKIHPTIVKVNQLWTIQYSQLRIANVNELYSLEALDLNSLNEWFESQIQLFENVIFHKWIPSVFKIVSDAVDKRRSGDSKEKKVQKFYESLSSLMTLQLQHLCCTTIREYTDFICDVDGNPGFQVHVLYKSNKIIFAPSYDEFCRALSNVYSMLLSAVSRVPRIETKLVAHADNQHRFLKPSVLPETIEQCRSRILETLQNEWICPELRIQDFDEYISLINGQSRIEVNKFLSKEHRLEAIEEKVSYYRDLGDEILLSCDRVVTMGLFEIHREHFVTILANKAQATKDRFLEKISDTYREACKCLTEEFQNIKDTLLRPPSDTAELVRKKEYSLNLGTKVFFEMEDRLRETMNKILFCSDFVPLTSAQIKLNSSTFLCYKRINAILEENQSIVREKTKVFQELLVNRVEAFKRDLERYRRETNEFQNYREAGELSKYLRKAQNLNKKFTAAEERIREFNEEEEAFGWMRTVYPEKDRLVEQLTPYKKLYENCANYKNKYQTWTEAKIGTFGPHEVEGDVETFHRNIIELSQQFSAIPAPYALTNSIRSDVEQFQKHMPIVKTLGNPCLKDRHWEKISEIVGFPMRVTDDLTLAKILDYGLEEYVPKFEVISDSATKENDLEMRLNGMMAEWENMKFGFSRCSGTYILASTEDIQMLLDDHIVKTQMMKSSPYIEPFEKSIRLWEEKLIFLQEMIDAWLLVQKSWLYLEPVFAVGDIQHLVADECKRFNAVDKVWKDVMKQAAADTSVMAVANVDKILERLVKCNHSLDNIRIGLSAFLEAKRFAFPRFFFLSDEEILDIVSNTRQPSGIEPFLRKCFDGAEKLGFTDDFDVIAIISNVGEQLCLCEEVDTGLHRGSVEKWLAQLEKIARLSIKREIRTAIDETEKYSWAEWSARRTQQAITVATALTVASEIENYLADANALSAILKKCDAKLEQMGSVAKGDGLLRTKLSLASLVIFWSHTRDILQKLIRKVHIDERMAIFSMEFAYFSQDEEIVARMVNRKITYGYEYVGNYSPAICTPLTERCYRSFFLAVRYNNAACLQGPTGSGKTEIIENFARMCARHLKTANCVAGLDERLIERFFKGVATCDSWVCFDNADVASGEESRTIDYWLATWRRARCLSEARPKCGVDGSQPPDHRLVFLTVSPAYYAQRRRLPTFSRNVVRWVSFERGEHRNVIRVKLAALAFVDADRLARKLNTLLRLCSSLFESHRFFRNDTRLVRRLLDSIEKLRSENPRWPEQKLVREGANAVLDALFAGRHSSIFRRVLDKVLGERTGCEAGVDERSEKMRRLVRLSASATHFEVDDRLLRLTTRLLKAIEVRDQGVIVCGRALVGKSTLIGLAAETLKRLRANSDVRVTVVNPKSISVSHLYGRRDRPTNRWRDGVFTALWRLDGERDRHKWNWLVMDGPVDPTWMETLNSALDESRSLRLSTGECVPGSLNARLIFETADLSHVSPSTACRCFVLHIDDDALEWRYLIRRWFRHLPASAAVYASHIHEMALRFCSPLLHFVDGVRRREGLMYPATNNHLTRSMLGIFDCFVDEMREEARLEETAETDLRSQLEGALLFSCIWSLGALLDVADRRHFDAIFRALLRGNIPDDLRNKYDLPNQVCVAAGKTVVSSIPDSDTVFDYRYLRRGKGKWKLWEEAEAASAIPRDVRFDEIVVPTRNTIRSRHLISLLVEHGQLVTLVGEATSGKTTAITNFFDTKLDRKVYEPVSLNFTANACSDSIRRLISCKLDKRKKGEYGPPLGIRYVIFIDDLNAASTDRFGANSAVELLRHCVEHRRWYAEPDSSPIRLTDLQYVCALTTTTSHRRDRLRYCARLLRHFNVIGNDAFDDQTLKSIYGKIMLWHLDTRGFGKEFDPCIDQIVDATLAIHRLVRTNLLPVPSKAHYIFNLRDFSRIIRGVVSSVPEAIEDLSAMKRLWVHEVLRVYHDRIIDGRDSNWFLSALKTVSATKLKEDLNALVRHLLAENETEISQYRLRKLIFCDFVNPKADVRNYAEVRDMDGLQSIVEGFLVEYNNVNKKPMNLLLFSYAIEHVCRICRILKQPRGHALLLGEYGCGKQSLARLAIHICEFEFFEIGFAGEYRWSDWREDVKSLLYAVFTEQHACLLLANIRILPDFVLEDVGSLLQTAQIPGIFTVDEEKVICEKMEAIDNQRDKSARTDGSREALLDMFLRRVKKQIHLVLVFHSSTYEFRRYASKYPSIVDHCTMNLFESWPAETQSVVARKLLANAECGYDDLGAVVELCERLYASAKAFALDPSVDVRFTQKSFIRLVTTFRDTLSKKFELLSIEKNSLDKAIDRLAKLGEDIPNLDEEKKKLEPVVKGHSDSLHKLEAEIEALRAEETEAEISTNGAKMAANKMEKQLAARKKEYEEKVERTKEARENVVESLRALTANDTAVLKAMKNPPKPVKLVAEAIAYVKDLKAEKGQESGKISEDFWKPAIKAICDSKFVDTLVAFDMNDVPVRTLRLLEEKIFHHEEADAAKIRNYSAAAEVIFRWVRVVYDYGQIVKMDSDIRMRVDEAGQQHADARLELQREEKTVEELRGKRERRTSELEAGRRRLEELRHREATCDVKRARAEQLVRALRSKSARWQAKKSSVVRRQKTVVGDSLLCAAILTFLTSLPEKVRRAKTEEWRSLVNSTSSVDAEFCLAGALSDEADLETEKLRDEFDDPFFHDNVAIVGHSSRYVLLDDPQNAVTEWLTRAQHSKGLISVRSDRPEWARNLENAVSSGCPVLLEHRDGELDAALHPLMEKRWFKTATGFAVRIGKNVVEFDPNFRLYVRTRMEEPRHSVETYEKLTVVNCAPTESGAKNAVAEVLLAKQNPNALAERTAAIAQLANARKAADEAESRIVAALTRDAQILDDEAATNGALASAQLCDDAERRVSEARTQLRAVRAGLGGYALAAQYSCSLFEVAGRMRELDSAYHFPLKWLQSLTAAVVDSIQNTENAEKREAAFSQTFLKMFYASVCRLLTETDKQVFDLLLAIRTIGKDEESDAKLRLICDRLRQDGEKGDDEDGADGTDGADRAEAFEKPDSTSATERPLSDAENVSLSPAQLTDGASDENREDAAFRQMIADVFARPENIRPRVRDFVSETLKSVYAESTPRDLDSIYRSTSCCSPVVVVATDVASNPLLDLFVLAAQKGMTIEKCVLLAPSEALDSRLWNAAQTAKCAGSWLVLSNVRLIRQVVDELEVVLETLTPQTVHPDFRLWLILESDRDHPSIALTNGVTVPYTSSNANGSSRNELVCRGWWLGRCALAAHVEERVYQNVAIFESGLRDSQSAFEWDEDGGCGQAETDVAFGSICEWLRLYRNAPPIGELVEFLSDCCYGAKIADEWDRRWLAAMVRSFWTRPRLSQIVDDGEAGSSSPRWDLPAEIRERKIRKTTREFVRRLLRCQKPAKRRTRPNSPTLLRVVVGLKDSLPSPFDRQLLQNGDDEDDERNAFVRHVVAEEVRWYERLVRRIESDLANLADFLGGRTFFDDRSEYLRNRLENGQIPVLCLAEGGTSCERVFETKRALEMTKGKREFLQSLLPAVKDARQAERICDPRFSQFPRSLATAYSLRLDDDELDVEVEVEVASSDPRRFHTFVVADQSDASDGRAFSLIGLRLQNASCEDDDATRTLRPPTSAACGQRVSPILVASMKKYDRLPSGTEMYPCPLFKVERHERADRRSTVLKVLFPAEMPVDECLRARIRLLPAADSL